MTLADPGEMVQQLAAQQRQHHFDLLVRQPWGSLLRSPAEPVYPLFALGAALLEGRVGAAG